MLADVSCYLQTDPGREEQLVGVYLRAAPPEGPAHGSAAPMPAAGELEEPVGWFAGVLLASAELMGHVLAPVGPIVGLFR
jgi:hypothetical protein